ncbi:uncharacterized mitochondrial protein ymf17 [Phtheirospermum japonicum]|uniref:Uncharacterized mitochondrial protein ymf17 n=1 Tax=Phtheirospermum japonicum TaxID=374723 RepID=A0A830D5P7_9LAMI|nr:uncharacterized mitochondrial protein ymf17 [Phtheirospermum japonicum]
MATSRSSSAAARLSRSAAAALRTSGSGQSMRSDLAAAIVRPRALIASNENQISIPTSLSTSFLNRIASHSALSRPYSTAAAASQVPGAKGTKREERSINWAAMVARVPNRTLWHMYEGMEEVLLDYVHQETTRTWMLISFRLFLIIAIKDAFLAVADL